MITAIAVAIATALVHFLLARATEQRYEQLRAGVAEALAAAQEARSHAAASAELLRPAVARLPKTRKRIVMTKGIGEAEVDQ